MKLQQHLTINWIFKSGARGVCNFFVTLMFVRIHFIFLSPQSHDIYIYIYICQGIHQLVHCLSVKKFIITLVVFQQHDRHVLPAFKKVK